MAPIPTKTHGILDYAGGVGLLAAPKALRDRRAAAALGVTGAGMLATSAMTDYELGIRRRIPMSTHLLIDAAVGTLLIGGAERFRRGGARFLDWIPLTLVGASSLGGALLTERTPPYQPRRDEAPMPGAPRGVGGASFAAREPAGGGVPIAPPPVEAPGPSVTPPHTPESSVERAEEVDALRPESLGPPDDDVLVAQEESAAAAEAGRIGGEVPAESDDPAMEPVYEAGGGEAEGFEAAEEELIENASHDEGRGQPERDALSPEFEADRSTAVYGETDQEQGDDR